MRLIFSGIFSAVSRYGGLAGMFVMIFCCGCELSRLNPFDPNGSAYHPPGIDTTYQGEIIASVYSERYLNYIQQPRYNIYVEARFVSFPDIQSVQVVFFDTLMFALNNLSSPGLLPFWKGLFLDDYFQGISVFEIVGHPPHLIVDLQFLDSTYQSQDLFCGGQYPQQFTKLSTGGQPFTGFKYMVDRFSR